MPDRHATTPIGVRLEKAEEQAVRDAAAAQGIAVRRWILNAIREKLSREAATPA